MAACLSVFRANRLSYRIVNDRSRRQPEVRADTWV